MRRSTAALGQRGVEGVDEHEADRPLGLRAAPVQRDRRDDGGGELVLDQQVADLGAVAVGEHDLVPGCDQVGDAAIATSAAAIWSSAGPPVGVRHGVAAEREQDPHASNLVTPRRRSPASRPTTGRSLAMLPSRQRPPATRSVVPVTYDASSLISQATASATSCGSPARPSGTSGPTRSSRPGSPASAWIVVRTMPGRDPDHPDALGGDLLGEPDGQRVDAGLRRGVLDVLPRRPERRRARADVDEHPAAPPYDVPRARTAARATSRAR